MSSKFEILMNQLGISDQLRRDPALVDAKKLSVLWFIKLVRFGNFICIF